MPEINTECFLPHQRARDQNFKYVFLKKFVNYFAEVNPEFLPAQNPTVAEIGSKSIDSYKQILKKDIPLKKNKTNVCNIWMSQKKLLTSYPKGCVYEIAGSKALSLNKEELIDYFKKLGLGDFVTQFVLKRWNKPANDVDPRTRIVAGENYSQRTDDVSLATLKNLAEIAEIEIKEENIQWLLKALGIEDITCIGDHRLFCLKDCDAGVGPYKAFCLTSENNMHVVIENPETLTEDLENVEFKIHTDANEHFVQAYASKGIGFTRVIDAKNKDFHAFFNLLLKLSQGEPCQDIKDFTTCLNTFLKHCKTYKYNEKKIARMFTRMASHHNQDVKGALQSLLLNFAWSLPLANPELAKPFTTDFLQKIWRNVFPNEFAPVFTLEEIKKQEEENPILSLMLMHKVSPELIGAAQFCGSALTGALPQQGKTVDALNYDGALSRHLNKPMMEVILPFTEPPQDPVLHTGHSCFLDFDVMRWATAIDIHYAQKTKLHHSSVTESLQAIFKKSCEAMLLYGLDTPPLDEHRHYLTQNEEKLLRIIERFIKCNDPFLTESATALAMALLATGSIRAESLLFERCLPQLKQHSPALANKILEKLVLFFSDEKEYAAANYHLKNYCEGDLTAYSRVLYSSSLLRRHTFAEIKSQNLRSDDQSWNSWLIHILRENPENIPSIVPCINVFALPPHLKAQWLEWSDGIPEAKNQLDSFYTQHSLQLPHLLNRIKTTTSPLSLIAELRDTIPNELDAQSSSEIAAIIANHLSIMLQNGASLRTIQEMMDYEDWEKHIPADKLKPILQAYISSDVIPTLRWMVKVLELGIDIPEKTLHLFLQYSQSHTPIEWDLVQLFLTHLQKRPKILQQHTDELNKLLLNFAEKAVDKEKASSIILPILEHLDRSAISLETRETLGKLLNKLKKAPKHTENHAYFKKLLRHSDFVSLLLHLRLDLEAFPNLNLVFKSLKTIESSHVGKLQNLTYKLIKNNGLTFKEAGEILSNPNSLVLLGKDQWRKCVKLWIKNDTPNQYNSELIRKVLELFQDHIDNTPDACEIAGYCLEAEIFKKMSVPLEAIWSKISKLSPAIDESTEKIFLQEALKIASQINPKEYITLSRIYLHPKVRTQSLAEEDKKRIQSAFDRSSKDYSNMLDLLEAFPFVNTKQAWQKVWKDLSQVKDHEAIEKALRLWSSRIEADNDFETGAYVLKALHQSDIQLYSPFANNIPYVIGSLSHSALSPELQIPLIEKLLGMLEPDCFLKLYKPFAHLQSEVLFSYHLRAAQLDETHLPNVLKYLDDNFSKKKSFLSTENTLLLQNFLRTKEDWSESTDDGINTRVRFFSAVEPYIHNDKELQTKICMWSIDLDVQQRDSQSILQQLQNLINLRVQFSEAQLHKISTFIRQQLDQTTLIHLKTLKAVLNKAKGHPPYASLSVNTQLIEKKLFLHKAEAKNNTLSDVCDSLEIYHAADKHFQQELKLQALTLLCTLPGLKGGDAQFNKHQARIIKATEMSDLEVFPILVKNNHHLHFDIATKLLKNLLQKNAIIEKQAEPFLSSLWTYYLSPHCKQEDKQQVFEIIIKLKPTFLGKEELAALELMAYLGVKKQLSSDLDSISKHLFLLKHHPHASPTTISHLVSLFTAVYKNLDKEMDHDVVWEKYCLHIITFEKAIMLYGKSQGSEYIKQAAVALMPLFTCSLRSEMRNPISALHGYVSLLGDIYEATEDKKLVSEIHCVFEKNDSFFNTENLSSVYNSHDIGWCLVPTIIAKYGSENKAAESMLRDLENSEKIKNPADKCKKSFPILFQLLLIVENSTTLDKKHYYQTIADWLGKNFASMDIKGGESGLIFAKLVRLPIPIFAFKVLRESFLECLVACVKRNDVACESLFKAACLNNLFAHVENINNYLETIQDAVLSMLNSEISLQVIPDVTFKMEFINFYVCMYLKERTKEAKIDEALWIIGLQPALKESDYVTLLFHAYQSALDAKKPYAVICFFVALKKFYFCSFLELKSHAFDFLKDAMEDSHADPKVIANFLRLFLKYAGREGKLKIAFEHVRMAAEANMDLSSLPYSQLHSLILEEIQHCKKEEIKAFNNSNYKLLGALKIAVPIDSLKAIEIEMAMLNNSFGENPACKGWLKQFERNMPTIPSDAPTWFCRAESFCKDLIEKNSFEMLSELPVAVFLQPHSGITIREKLAVLFKTLRNLNDDTLELFLKILEHIPSGLEKGEHDELTHCINSFCFMYPREKIAIALPCIKSTNPTQFVRGIAIIDNVINKNINDIQIEEAEAIVRVLAGKPMNPVNIESDLLRIVSFLVLFNQHHLLDRQVKFETILTLFKGVLCFDNFNYLLIMIKAQKLFDKNDKGRIIEWAKVATTAIAKIWLKNENEKDLLEILAGIYKVVQGYYPVGKKEPSRTEKEEFEDILEVTMQYNAPCAVSAWFIYAMQELEKETSSNNNFIIDTIICLVADIHNNHFTPISKEICIHILNSKIINSFTAFSKFTKELKKQLEPGFYKKTDHWSIAVRTWITQGAYISSEKAKNAQSHIANLISMLACNPHWNQNRVGVAILKEAYNKLFTEKETIEIIEKYVFLTELKITSEILGEGYFSAIFEAISVLKDSEDKKRLLGMVTSQLLAIVKEGNTNKTYENLDMLYFMNAIRLCLLCSPTSDMLSKRWLEPFSKLKKAHFDDEKDLEVFEACRTFFASAMGSRG